jgi:hypothetical protein
MTCCRCNREIAPTYQPDKGDWQAVWANTKDGPAHTPECPPPRNPISGDEE